MSGVAMWLAMTTPKQADEAVRLYPSALSMEKVAERLGLFARTIFTIIRERRIAARETHVQGR